MKRGKTEAVKLEVRKKIELELSTNMENKPAIPTPDMPYELDPENIVAFSWNKNKTEVLFLDKTDSMLKIRKVNGALRPITILKNINPPLIFYWSDDEKYIIASNNNDIYFIGTEQGSRKKHTIDFMPANIVWSPGNNFILLNDKEYNLYKINKIRYNDMKKIKNKINLRQSVWLDENTLIGYQIDAEQNKTAIFTYYLPSEKKEVLIEKFAFPADEINYNKEEKTIYLRSKAKSQWYKIKME